MSTTAHMFEDEGQRYLYLETEQDVWEEPIKGWTLVLDFVQGGIAVWRNDDGRTAIDAG